MARRNPLQITDDRQRLNAVLKEFSTVMLGTFEEIGSHPSLRARPMHIARIDDDCVLHFVTRRESEQVVEAEITEFGHVFAQSSTQFVSMQGEMQLSADRATLKLVWSKAYEVWLSGPDDPAAALLTFKPTDAEIWDVSGLKGLRFLFQSARSLVTGDKQPNYGSELHERMQMPR